MTTVDVTLYGLESPNMTIGTEHMVLGMNGPVDIPLAPFLIVHGDDLVLFDTGFHPMVCDDPALLFGNRPEADMIESNPEQKLDRQLEKLGYSVADVTHLVVSHIHMDHAGGLYLFPNAKFYVGPGEFDYGRNPNPESAHLVRNEDFLTDEILGYDWTEVSEERFDLFGDGTVQLLHLPGHTPGQLAVLVRLSSRSVILTADVVHLREAAEKLAAAPTDWNQDISVESIKKMLTIAEEEDAELWVAHDYRDWELFGGPLKAVR